MGRISGPLLDRFDLRIEVPPVAYTDLDLPCDGQSSSEIRKNVCRARDLQAERFRQIPQARSNADAHGELLEHIAAPDASGRELLGMVAEKFKLSARGYHRVLRVSRTIADLDGSDVVQRKHIGEAASFRLMRANEFA